MDLSSVFFYVPPTHSQLMAGIPIPARLFDRDVLISPLTIRAIQTLNTHLRQIYLQQHIELLADVSSDIKEQAVSSLIDKSKNLTVEYGEGQLFLFTNVSSFCMVLAAYLSKSEPTVDETWVKEKCCTLNQVSVPAVALLQQIQSSVVVSYPKQQELPKKNEPELPKFFDDTDAEAMVRLIRGLAERYHFTIDQILDMTPYMCHCMLFVLPEEHRRYLEMEAIANKGASGAPTPAGMAPPAGSGVVQMTPEEFNIFRMQQDAKKRMEKTLS